MTDLGTRVPPARAPGRLGAVHHRYRCRPEDGDRHLRSKGSSLQVIHAEHDNKATCSSMDGRVSVVIGHPDVFQPELVDLSKPVYDVLVVVDPEGLDEVLRADVDPTTWDPGGPTDPLNKHLVCAVAFSAGPAILDAPPAAAPAIDPPKPRPQVRPSSNSSKIRAVAVDAAIADKASRWPTALFWAAVAVAAIYRFVVLLSGGAPATVDSGNWLAFGEQLFGGGTRSDSIAYPPVVPALATLSVWLFGTHVGVAILGAISSLAPGLGLYKSLQMVGMDRSRVFPAVLLIGAGSVSEATAWGGFPQLLGLGLLPIGVALGLRYLDAPDWKKAGRLGLIVMASLGVSHFLSVVLIASLAVSGAGALVRARSLSWLWRVAKTLPVVLVPSVWLIPTYRKMIDAVIFHPNEFAALDNLTSDNSLDRLEHIYSDLPIFWEVALPLSLMTPLLCWSRRSSQVWRMQVSVLGAAVVMLALTRESRYLYLFPLIGALGTAVWVSLLPELRAWARRRGNLGVLQAVVVPLAIITGALQLQGGLLLFQEQREFYGVLTPQIVDAIETANQAAGEDGTIAVPSLGDAPIGWWVEALSDGEVFYGSPLRWLNFPDEVERARLANEIFDPSFPSDDTLELLAARDVDVVIVPTRWAWYDADAIDDWIDDEGLDVLVRHDDALTISLR
jgi:hypothetical protein